MILCIKNQTVIGINQSFCPAVTAVIIQVALIVFPPVLLRKLPLIIAKMTASDAPARCHIRKIPLLTVPAKLLCFLLGDIVVREPSVGMEVRCV